MTKEEIIQERLKLLGRGQIPVSVRAGTLSLTSSFYYGEGREAEGEENLERCLDDLTEMWRSCVRDMNDIRLYQQLTDVKVQFSVCYSAMRRYSDIAFAYEKVLQFKDVASLAIRERNRIYHSHGMKGKLQLGAAHNEMAGRAAGRILRNRAENYLDDAAYLKKLAADAEFGERFPKDAAFQDITWAKVREAIPDNSVVLEYFLCDDDEYNSYGAEASIDVYIIRKRNHRCSLRRETIPNGKSVLKTAGEFLSAFRREAEGITLHQGLDRRQKEAAGRNLYRWLIAPVIDQIQDVRHLYIAPDRDLINLPFELLKNDDGVRLGVNQEVVQLECARDFLFCYQKDMSARGSLIIGNPQYEVWHRDWKKKRILRDIPFSGVEACLVGRLCNSPYYVGEEAAKELLLSAEGYQNIHIATHGYFDSSKEAAYGSILAFAGAEDWMQTGQQSKQYGNGIVTADEISRLNLHSVELAVISSCDSGMNEILENKGFHGLLGGFSAAGVRYIISSLWAADDLAATILMGYFYYMYQERHKEPYTALKEAKQYLQNVSIGQLKQDGWFAYMRSQSMDSESRKLIRQYEMENEWEQPFEREVYWGGFICYRCN